MVPPPQRRGSHNDDTDEDDDNGYPYTENHGKMPSPTSFPQEWVSRSDHHLPPYSTPTLDSQTTSTTADPLQSLTESPFTSTPAASEQQSLPSTTGFTDNYSNRPDWPDNKGSSHTLLYVAAGVVPVVFFVILGAFIFFCLRKRKKQRMITASQAKADEMRMRNHQAAMTQQPASVHAFIAPPAPAREPSYTAPPSHSPPASPMSAGPVILGPISSGANGNYMTGIDTSDVVSVRNERTGLGDPFADGNSLHEEPPPPYRPRSNPPLSRDTSLRVPAAATSQTNLMDNREQPLRSPFADPEDDDAVSEISGPGVRRNRDNMSVVSDMSYQQDPVVSRPAM